MHFLTLGSGFAIVTCGILLPWIEFADGSVAILDRTFPMPLVAILLLLGSVGGGWQAWQGMKHLRRLPTKSLAGLAAVILFAVLGFAGVWYGYLLNRKLLAFEYRPNARMLLLLGGAILIAAALPRLDPSIIIRRALLAARRFGTTRSIAAIAAIAMVFGAAIGWIVLDGMPHMRDALTYLLQGRMLWTGHLALEVPAHPELFRSSIFFPVTDAGYFGKYPWGWPAVLGLFDRLSMPWLAAPLLAGGLVFCVCQLVAREAGKRLAILAGVFLAGCPWLWYNAATQMSHVASAFWLMLFLNAFYVVRRNPSVVRGLLAGLSLGAAVMTRPQDAFFFSAPCVVLAGSLVVSNWRRWLWPQLAVAAGAMAGLATYFSINRYLCGSAVKTGYGGTTPFEALFAQSPQSSVEWLSWLQESWVGLSVNGCVGALPAGIGIIVALVFAWKYAKRMDLLLLSSTSLFAGYTVFVFQSRPWVGQRWLFPLLPAMAYLMACGVVAAIEAARANGPIAPTARFYLRVVVVSLAVCWFVLFPVTLYQMWTLPPQIVDGRVAKAVAAAGLTNATIALPTESSWEEYKKNTYKDPRAGMWTMKIPIEDSSVIFVRNVDNWQTKALRTFPGRKLYWMDAKPDNFNIYPVTP